MEKGFYKIFFLLIIFDSFYAQEGSFDDDVKYISEYTDINLLLAVQILLPNSDSKDFVDRATKKPIKEISKEFVEVEKDLGLSSLTGEMLSIDHAITQTRISDLLAESIIAKKKQTKKMKMMGKLQVLKKFIDDNFHPVGFDIIAHHPEDFDPSPRFLDNLKNKEVLEVSKALNEIWKELSRKKNEIKDGGVSSLLDLPFPFMIPGGRFREFYYWDTYWILEGLLVCDMAKSAENIVRNFISIIRDIGYIPNGTRKYYLNRSQPPFFTMMLLKLLDYDDGKFNELVLGEGLEMAIKEYEFFDKHRKIEVKDSKGNVHSLNQFHVHTNFPRPESFSEDILTFEKLEGISEETVFSNLKTGAESGWDFSSRWLEKETELKTIEAFYQIPVDLNAIIYRNELILHTLLKRKGDDQEANKFLKRSEDRKKAINAILWNEKEGSWTDFVVSTQKFVDYRFYFSNVTPLFYGISPPDGKTNFDVLSRYSKEIFGYPGGIPASGDGPQTMQQWDFPNVWAPHQHMMVEYLLSIDERNMAFHVAKSFYNSVNEGYKQSKAFFEKYNCLDLGNTGGGGEYAPQTGFGWTNGTALSFILKYGDKLGKSYDFDKGYKRILSSLLLKTSGVSEKLNPSQTQKDFEAVRISENNEIIMKGILIK